jgi:hypothetical protein
MKLLRANKNKSTESDESKRKVGWIREKPNVWRVFYAD